MAEQVVAAGRTIPTIRNKNGGNVMKIAILDDYQGIALKMADWKVLADHRITVFRDHLFDANALVERLRDFEIVTTMRERTPFGRELLEKLPNLKLLVTTGLHNASIDLDTATRLGILVCGTGGGKTRVNDVQELTWGLILAVMRHIPQEDAAIRRGQFQNTIGTVLQGKVLGLMGLGRLGSLMAPIGRAFEMSIIAWSQNLTSEIAKLAGAELVTKDQLFSRSDILSIHLQLSDRTRGLVGARELSLMKPTAYLINTSRGPIVNERDLFHTLETHAIAGAGLDVFDQEPLPDDYPFKRLDNVVMTPHLGYVTEETYHNFYPGIVEDIVAYLGGRPIKVMNPNVVPNRRSQST
jgi:phosphoglycerate dehydrogenase-like enzyme